MVNRPLDAFVHLTTANAVPEQSGPCPSAIASVLSVARQPSPHQGHDMNAEMGTICTDGRAYN